jgi:hypothetical protein
MWENRINSSPHMDKNMWMASFLREPSAKRKIQASGVKFLRSTDWETRRGRIRIEILRQGV